MVGTCLGIAGAASGAEVAERGEAKLTLGQALKENARLREELSHSETAVATLQKNLAMATSEAEIFRRQTGELKLRLEALGMEGVGGDLGKIEQRLLKAVSDLKLCDDERRNLQHALIEFSEAVLNFQRSAVSTDAEARLALEIASRSAAKALGVTPPSSVEAPAVPSTLMDGMVVSIKEDLALIVANLGAKHGVKVGMPFQVMRGDDVIGTVRVVDVRERISGAVIQNLHSEQNRIKVNDRLKVDAQP